MGNWLRMRKKPLAGLLAALMVINVIAPMTNLTHRLTRAEGNTIPVETLLKDQMSQPQQPGKKIGITLDVPEGGISYNNSLDGYLNFLIPDSSVFNKDNCKFTYNFSEVLGYKKDENGNLIPPGQAIIDLSKFPESDLEGAISFNTSISPNPYKYKVDRATGIVTFDFSGAWDENGKLLEKNKMSGELVKFEFTCGIEESAF